MNTNTIELKFTGPYSWFEHDDIPALDDAPMAKDPGIYLWAVSTNKGELVYYIGETGRNFSVRMSEHLTQQLSGNYCIYDPEQFCRGIKKPLWNGMYGKTKESGINDFLDKLPALADDLNNFVKLIHFWLAPLECKSRLRIRIEAAIAIHLNDQPGIIGSFQDEGVRYKSRQPDEDPIFAECYSSSPIMGFPCRLEI